MAHGFELFSDIFVLRDNALRRLDVRVKWLAVLAICGIVLVCRRPYLPLGVFAVAVGALRWVRLPVRLMATRLALPLGMAVVLCVLRAFLVPGEALWSVQVWRWTLVATRSGLAEGVLLASRVLGSMSVLILFSTVTPAHEVFAALRWLRMPRTWVETAMLMYRYTFALVEHAADVFSAQRTRLGYVGWRRSLGSVGTLAGSVLMRSMEQAERTHQAMVARGYSGQWPTRRMGRVPVGQALGAMLLVGVLVALWWATERWGR